MKNIFKVLICLTLIGCETSIPSTPEGMVWIPGGTFEQGALENDLYAMQHEKPRHKVKIDGFFMDVTVVTNKKFKEFINKTGYITVAERAVDWNEIKSQLPENTPKPHDSVLEPGSLVFKKSKVPLDNLNDFFQWWKWKIGANWNNVTGDKNNINIIQDDLPVVHVSYEDALAYCMWANRRLPTEAEWEYAARANKKDNIFTWGNNINELHTNANTWEGDFPITNSQKDGYERLAPVKTYPANNFGLYGMAGNVWEWCEDKYDYNAYQKELVKGTIQNPEGSKVYYDTGEQLAPKHVMRGGSFLCNDSYCSGYRVSRRMSSSRDSSFNHTGFRCVQDL